MAHSGFTFVRTFPILNQGEYLKMHLHTRLRAPPFSLPCRPSLNAPSNLLSRTHLPANFLHCNRFRPISLSSSTPADVGAVEGEKTDKLKRNLEAVGLHAGCCSPGQFDLLYCPKCEGGRLSHRTLSLHINKNWSYAMWRCFQLQCGWAGKVFADTKREGLKLEMLGDELLAYFAERKISRETLRRNGVMQVAGDRETIAFPYKRNGQHVGCKYRTAGKKFRQAKNSEKVFYGLDDIAGADEIIIVEGEIDKLSMEEAGFYNCVSVPGGAPQTVSLKELPSLDKDTSFQYIWNCSDYLDKASRIILATDSDAPGHALAEELSRRLGRERCRRVHWPKKDDVSSFKDANEVLVNLGVEALRDAVDKAGYEEVGFLE